MIPKRPALLALRTRQQRLQQCPLSIGQDLVTGHAATISHQPASARETRPSQLEALPGWTWTKVADQWETGFKLLMVYSHREGAARPPAGFVEDGGFRLGKWVGRQRDFHDAGRISEERAARLAALPGWTWDGLVHQWETGYEHLATFVREQGHSRVTKRHVASDGYRLGQWIDVQRRAKRGGTLSLERVARLDAQPGWDKDLQG